MRFGKTEEDPLDYDAVIIDEASMVDLLLMNGLVNAIKPGTRLIMVGRRRSAAVGRRGKCPARHNRQRVYIFRQAR